VIDRLLRNFSRPPNYAVQIDLSVAVIRCSKEARVQSVEHDRAGDIYSSLLWNHFSCLLSR